MLLYYFESAALIVYWFSVNRKFLPKLTSISPFFFEGSALEHPGV